MYATAPTQKAPPVSVGIPRVRVTVASPTSASGRHPFFLAKINRFVSIHTQQPQPRQPHLCLRLTPIFSGPNQFSHARNSPNPESPIITCRAPKKVLTRVRVRFGSPTPAQATTAFFVTTHVCCFLPPHPDTPPGADRATRKSTIKSPCCPLRAS